ncbi:MAG TPA: S-methyl-5-thioribose-1-phosphate isomerase, partial [Thermoplasmatales archaeon]|nr:S-methyl-5-thioribose-1-phosphate isomerase [Thermoplasmatales archaeon]
DIPFYVAVPASTFDSSIKTGEDIVIEERDEMELKEKDGYKLMPEWVKVKNPAFDITPSKYITSYITEDGIKKSL